MADTRLINSLPNHPKTKKVIRKLGYEGSWKLVCLFLWASENKPEGTFENMGVDDIEIAVDWGGEEGAFVQTLVEVGFVDHVDGVYSLHDWHEHNPWACGAVDRKHKAKHAALTKHYGKEKADLLMQESAQRKLDSATSIPNAATSIPQAEVSSAPFPNPLPLPNPLPNPNPSQNQNQKQKPLSAKADVVEVFEYWKGVTGKSRARLDKPREKYILDRMKEGYTVDDLKKAIDGNKLSHWHQGHNPSGRIYNELSYCIGEAKRVDDNMALVDKPTRPKTDAELRSERNGMVLDEALGIDDFMSGATWGGQVIEGEVLGNG